jgi:hypothetical protein
MQMKLSEYPKHLQPFVKWYKRTYWSIFGLNSENCSLLDYSDKSFNDYTTQALYDAYKVGVRHGKKS